MRALYTQFSFLVGFLSVFEFMATEITLLAAIALGTATATTVYIALLLGDFTVHRFLEERSSAPSSIRTLDPVEETVVTASEHLADEAVQTLDNPAVRAA